MSDDSDRLFELFKQTASEDDEGNYKKKAMKILKEGNLMYLAGIKE